MTTPRVEPGLRGPRAAVYSALGAILLAGLALRVWILGGPLGEVEADESVVGLMALHILQAEHFAFYWGQPYLGSLEAYLAAVAFAVFGPSNLVLKAVPGCVFLVFVLLVFLTARRELGTPVALLSALYLALPPSFLALWSVKARGGYVELLALGQALLFAAPWVAAGRSSLAARLGLAGLLGGALLWTHLLGLVYLVPVACYLVATLGRRLLGPASLAGLVGLLVGLSPAVAHNLAHEWETISSLGGGGSSSEMIQENLGKLAQVGLPVLVGFGQPTSSPVLFAQDWPSRPGSWPWVPPLLLSVLLLALLPALRIAAQAIRRRAPASASTGLLSLGVLALTPLLASAGRFGELIAEPRYALPLYSTVPLFALALVRLGRRSRAAAAATVCFVIGVNALSLLTADPRLNLPTTAAGSTAANRAELLAHLTQHGVQEIYTDYWLAYPLMFESQERVLASVSSGGYNRFAPYAYFVSISDSPGFVLIRDSPEHIAFERRLTAAGGSANRQSVSIYEVYTRVSPVEPLRP